MVIGPGIIILAFIWALSFLICKLLSRSGGMVSWLSIVLVFFLALIITMILIFFPRAKETPEPVTDEVIFDNFFIGRYCLLCILIVAFLAGLVLLLPHYIVGQRDSKHFRSFWQAIKKVPELYP